MDFQRGLWAAGHPITGERKTKMAKDGPRSYVYYRCARYTKPGHPRIRIQEAEFDRQIPAIFDKMRIEDESIRDRFRAVLRSQTRDFQTESLAQRSPLLHSHRMSDVTHLLEAAAAGDRHAAAELLPLVYDELRKLAAARMAAESPGQTLQPTALVHEAYLRLVGDQRFDGRGHFFAAAAEAMRRILVNHARDRNRLKRGGGRVRLELLDQADSLAEDPDLVLSLDELLTRLGEEDATAARVAHLHLFGGLSVEEAGAALGVSRAVAYRNWKYARAWLRDALEK